MSSHLSKDLKTKHNIRSLPIRRDDEVIIVRGRFNKKNLLQDLIKEIKVKSFKFIEKNGAFMLKKSANLNKMVF